MKLLKFYGEHCPMCKVLSNTLKRNNIQTLDINAEENITLAESYGIRNIPTLILVEGNTFDEMKEVARLNGCPPINMIINFLNENNYENESSC